MCRALSAHSVALLSSSNITRSLSVTHLRQNPLNAARTHAVIFHEELAIEAVSVLVVVLWVVTSCIPVSG
jgi:hypothetical protein